jgi:hypothetical protein
MVGKQAFFSMESSERTKANMFEQERAQDKERIKLQEYGKILNPVAFFFSELLQDDA